MPLSVLLKATNLSASYPVFYGLHDESFECRTGTSSARPTFAQRKAARYFKVLQRPPDFRSPSNDKRDQHEGPNHVEEMPIASAVVDRPVSFVIVLAAKSLTSNVSQKDHPADHM